MKSRCPSRALHRIQAALPNHRRHATPDDGDSRPREPQKDPWTPRSRWSPRRSHPGPAVEDLTQAVAVSERSAPRLKPDLLSLEEACVGWPSDWRPNNLVYSGALVLHGGLSVPLLLTDFRSTRSNFPKSLTAIWAWAVHRRAVGAAIVALGSSSVLPVDNSFSRCRSHQHWPCRSSAAPVDGVPKFGSRSTTGTLLPT